MKCSACGFENEPGAKFCGQCGAAMSTAAPAGGDGKAVSDGLNITMIILSILFPIVGIIMGIIYMNDANPDKKTAGKRWLIISIVAAVASCLLIFVCNMAAYNM